MKTYKELLEAKTYTATDLRKELESSDWGYSEKGGNGRVKVKGKNIVIYDSYYFGGDDALKRHIKKWSQGGENETYFSKYDLKMVDSGRNMKSKLFKGSGDVWVELEVNVSPF